MNEYKTALDVNWQLSNKRLEKTEYYELDLATTSQVEVSTIKGIVEILNFDPAAAPPGLSMGMGQEIYINNPKLLLTEANRDNIYIQYSVYYKQNGDDKAIPYVLSNGVNAGVGFKIYNLSPQAAGVDQWTGKLYVYYEIYTK